MRIPPETTLLLPISRGSTLVGAALLALAGCASKPPQGYGVAQSAAAQAQQQFEQAQQAIQPDARQTYLDLITQMQQAGQWYASLAHVDAMEQQHGSSPESQLLRADALRNTGQNDAARAVYQRLLGSPVAARAHRGLGLLHATQGDYAGAIAQLEQARLRNPIDANVLSDIAYAHMLDGQLAAARVPALQAAQLAPDNARVQLNLALFWLAAGQTGEAQALLHRLSQPGARGSAPLIDAESAQGLQRQLAQVRQAMAARAQPVSPPPPTVAPPQQPGVPGGTTGTPTVETADAQATLGPTPAP